MLSYSFALISLRQIVNCHFNKMSAIHKSIKEESIERAKYFQTVHAWPLSDKLNYEGWLSNFQSEDDLNIACLILDFFIYFSEGLMDNLLVTSIGNSGRFLSKEFPGWNHDYFKEKCIYSFIPGENPNPTDSGPIFTRKLKEVLGVNESRIIFYGDIVNKLKSMGKKPTPVVLVDDFVGTGNQCIKAWKDNEFSETGLTLKAYAAANKHRFVYAPLIANKLGYDSIKTKCPDLFLSPAHVLDDEYNLFDKNCICWKGNEALYKDGIKLIIETSERYGIPNNNGRKPVDVYGFGKQGLAIGFETGPPDAVPAFFYWCDNGWTPLVKRHYER